MSQDSKTFINRRDVLRGISAAGVGASATLPLARSAHGQSKKPIKLSFWTFDNPQQRPWVQKRVKLFMEQNPHVTIDFQWFAFADLGKKLSVGFATGTAPDGFVSQDWFMPVWLDKKLIAPLDIAKLGFASQSAMTSRYAKAFVDGAVHEGKVYGYPMWFYGFCNYLNTKQFKEAGLDPDKDYPQDWAQLGEVAKALAVKKGDRFERQGFKFAMHAAQWTIIQFNPILLQSGGQWFDAAGKCTINNDAGIAAMTIRSSIARKYGAEDPADSIATNPLPGLDWLKERSSMFFIHPVPPEMVEANNPTMAKEGYYRPVQYPGVERGKGYSTTYGFNLVISAKASDEKKDVLHDLYKFMMADPLDSWKDTAPFTLADNGDWAKSPQVQSFRNVGEIFKARDQGVFLPRSLVFNELADALHKGVQRIMLNKADIKTTLNEVAAEVDRASASYK